jgi:8-oxo-dGTP pyrophosphatase MutT (NUDIX family)
MKKSDKWKTLKRDKILHTPVFDVYKEKAVCLRNNFSWDFYTLECPHNWVTVVAVTVNNEIVMVKQFRYGSRNDELEVPGGLTEIGESPLDAGVRELKEETGYVGKNVLLLGKVCPNPAIQGNFCYTVLVEEAEKKFETEFDNAEDIQTVLIPLDRLEKDISSGEITHGLALNSLFFYKLELEKRMKFK